MALKRPQPSQVDSKKYKVIKYRKVGSKNRSGAGHGTTFSRLTVLWVQQNGVTFNTTGFFATLSRNNRTVSRASFDSFGVVRFNNIRVLTTVSYTLRTFDSRGVLFRERTIPAGVEAFAIIG
ncbi:hypothetical protein [Cohnella sp. AR92]|uniref:hypothetical protein n=1 Tax=Cohnella sp. AR92 TaxID=648716 RepID=UPI000F8C9E31|nr:hypothetical protein [Cohnella sp. AR92]RUS42069.1 hypothetical protein ELR57_27525 [Cohnella sp. AR92]